MSCLVKKSNICSPETTVSSLLSSGNFKSDHDSLSHSSVQYKDKLYSSASQALEAYIKDFDLNLSSPDVRPGKIEILRRAPENFKSSKDDFEAKKNVKQHRRLGRRIVYEPDIVSLTTDDLLALPADGSLSFRISRSLAQRSNVNRRSWTASASCSHHWTSSFHNKEKEDSLKNSLLPSSHHEASRKKGTYDTEKLIQKARKVLEPSAEQSTSLLKNDGSPCTVDVLEAERAWDNVPIGLKPPVPISCVEENSPPNPKASMVNNFLEDCLQNGEQESTFSGGNHHGPVEALKLMLFNLQAVQHSFHKNKSDRPNEESPKVSSSVKNEILHGVSLLYAYLHLALHY
uniref:Lung adenoma susceptibility protein 2 n=1 Tax=Naja naja TaxID=35670 RepID=A0A8C6XRF1_NAJNA